MGPGKAGAAAAALDSGSDCAIGSGRARAATRMAAAISAATTTTRIVCLAANIGTLRARSLDLLEWPRRESSPQSVTWPNLETLHNIKVASKSDKRIRRSRDL